MGSKVWGTWPVGPLRSNSTSRGSSQRVRDHAGHHRNSALSIIEIAQAPGQPDRAAGLPGSMIPIRIGARESTWWDAEVAVMRSRVTAKPLDVRASIEINLRLFTIVGFH